MSAKTGATKGTNLQRMRKLGNDVVKMVLYNGRHAGHGKYMAGEVNGKLVVDGSGKPLEYRQIGELVESVPAKSKASR